MINKIALKFPGSASDEITEDFTDLPLVSTSNFGSSTTPADLVSTIIPFVFVFAGLILFGMVIAGGFAIFTSAGNPEKIKKGQTILTNALIGFLIIFASYWIIQFLEFTFGITIFVK